MTLSNCKTAFKDGTCPSEGLRSEWPTLERGGSGPVNGTTTLEQVPPKVGGAALEGRLQRPPGLFFAQLGALG